MTNDDLKQELDTIHFALNDLKNLCSKKGIKAVHLDGFVHLIEQKYSDLHENLVSTLNTYTLSDILHSEGKDAALKYADNMCSKKDMAEA